MTCQARPDRYERGSMRCDACRLVWDVEEPACGKMRVIAWRDDAPLKFASGLPFSSLLR